MYKPGLSSFISLILWCSKVEKYTEIRACGRWPSVINQEALALFFACAAVGNRWQCEAKWRNVISHCFHLICFLSHISVCGSRGRGRRVRRGGRGWEFPSCFSSGAECEGNNSWSDSRHSLGQELFWGVSAGLRFSQVPLPVAGLPVGYTGTDRKVVCSYGSVLNSIRWVF